ncbi:Brp/Blh family beta-carotene 15,15'-dioxygenase, partial [Altererythrobacter sp. MTPC7]|uniref:Brp/Blh family beta-carotene 15,15'-dioxygenase n=1 Tax=Altererythrobacter sp. MTPC7 TaxID=3056567 RepID=UPI0036F1BA5A
MIALIALSLGAAYLPASGPAFTALITLAILFGGLPHGAFDIHIAAQRCAMRWREICIYLGVYLGLFFAMAALWFASAELALVLFFAI